MRWYSVAALREIDRRATSEFGLPSLLLMEHAAMGVVAAAQQLIASRSIQRVVLVCGSGSNGGDGFAAARLLSNALVPVGVISVRAPQELAGDAGVMARAAEALGLAICVVENEADIEDVLGERDESPRLIIDALLGTGLSRAPEGVVGRLIEWMNDRAASDALLAVDVPSGFDADRGPVFDPCVRADVTVSLVGLKLGFGHPRAGAVIGRVTISEIGAPRQLLESLAAGDGPNAEYDRA